MAKLLLLTLVFPPDSVSTSMLLGDLAKELKKLGNDITVLTTTPHYNQEPEALARQPLCKRGLGLLYRSTYFGIPVYHVSIPVKGSRVGSRLIDYARFHIISTIVGIFVSSRYDLMLVPSPPLTIGLSAWLLGLIKRVPFIYNVQEIYPDIAIKLGVLCNWRLIRLMEWLERFIYNHASVVVVISNWFRRRLLFKGVPDEKICVIPNFVDTDFIKPAAKNSSFARIYGLQNQFVVLYAGNIGLTQSFETIIAAADKLANLPNLQFLIVGNGTRQSWLKKELAQKQLSNIRLLSYQPHSIVPQIYASSDVCLVPLKKGTAQGTFPSKIYSIMAAGRPAIISADNDSELTAVVKQAGCGLLTPPDDTNDLVKAIEYVYSHQIDLQRMGQKGREYVLKYHSRQAIGHQYHKLISEMLSPR